MACRKRMHGRDRDPVITLTDDHSSFFYTPGQLADATIAAPKRFAVAKRPV
jgi:hypothetical protein